LFNTLASQRGYDSEGASEVLLLISDAKGGLRFVAVGRIRSML